MASKNNKTPVLYNTKLCVSFQIQLVYSNWSYSQEMLNSGKIWRFFFVPRDLEIWWMTLKNNRTPLLYYIKLCAAFQSHWHIQTGVTVRKRSIGVKIGNFLSRVTLKIDVWPRKTIGHLSYAVNSNWSYSPETPNLGQNRLWPWNLTDDLEEQYQSFCIISSPCVNSNWSYGPETAKRGHDLCDPDFDNRQTNRQTDGNKCS